MATTTNSQSTIPTNVHLKIGNHQELQEFLNEIQPLFLDLVDPLESGLWDHMISKGLVTDGDRESLSGKDVRTDRDQRRKVWFHLTELSVADMKTNVFPKLYEEFHHIIPKKFLTQEPGGLPDVNELDGKRCLRHDIKRRVRPGAALDKMYQYKFLDLDKYRSLAKDTCKGDRVWSKFFETRMHTGDNFLHMIKDLLEMHGILVPACLKTSVSCGIPCTCNDTSMASPASLLPVQEKVDSWRRDSPCEHSPRSSGSSWGKGSASICSISSDISECEDSKSLISTGNTMFTYASNPNFAFCFETTGGDDVGRETGHSNRPFGLECQTTPQDSVTVEMLNPPVETPKLEACPNKIQTTGLVSASSDAVEAMEGQDGLPLGGGTSTNLPPTAGGGQSLAEMPVSVLSQIKKFIDLRHLIIIVCLVLGLLFVLGVNGFNIFQLIRGLCDPEEELLHRMQLELKNLTRTVATQSEQLKSLEHAVE